MNIRNYLYKRGVGWYLALAFSGLSILLTLVLGEVIGVIVSDRIKSNIGNGLSQLALQTSDKLDRGMFERFREVHLMAQRPDLISPGVPSRQKRAVLDALQDTYPYYAWIGMTDINGKVLASTKGVLEGGDVSKRAWHANAMKGVNLGDVHNAVLLSKMLPPQEDGEPLRFIDIAFPYYDSHRKMLGVMGTHLSWQWAQDIEQSIFEPIKQSRNVEALILAQDGTVLLGPDALEGEKLALQSIANATDYQSSYVVERWPDGKQYLVGYTKSRGYAVYPGLGWTILVRQSLDEAFLPVRTLQRQVLWTGAALALIFCLLGLLASRRISEPLKALADAARRVREGESALIPKENSFIELRALSSSLNALITNLLAKENDLRDLNLTLEKRVDQRTEELQQALIAVQASERRVQTIIEAAQDAYIAVDPQGKITGWNTRAEAMFGWTKDDAIGKSLHELILPERYRMSFVNALKRYEETGEAQFVSQRRERIVLNRAGQEFTVEMSAGIVHWENGWFFTAFLHDISERKEIARMKDEFISTVSHELRTPLTSIRASLSMLAE
ncbi:MAG TPA: PAS domain S-box protein, partial [Oxalicibacterium sp.]|uniref:PAS domain S-box protein n=1 Tax=Oxalicibacterium sp. TaxID=2766525 RepID=UPI002BED2245